MNTAVINIKIDPSVKKKAQKLAQNSGMSLSGLLKTLVYDAVRTGRVDVNLGEEPSPYLIKVLKKARANRKAGYGSPIFNTGGEAVKWLGEQGI